ncbi:MAG: hypothetical protein AMJ45_05285 [Syntrophobacter sp. DG_60]|nr:MAG: hypothetical protein AMJ45_05285 [Syntrophobacter sp. DG_60]
MAEERPVYKTPSGPQNRKAIESSFPFEAISNIAEIESWRKEIYRPIYHIHKWWAQRLGSVFRAIIIGACTPPGTDIFDLFYKRVRFPDSLVYDPFMGSGTTLGEARKIGCRVIGRDINPVSYFIVKNALSSYLESEVRGTFHSIEHGIADKIKAYYKAQTKDYGIVDVLYYFWVKVLPCPNCGNFVDLFSKRIFVQHAYPSRYGGAKSLCPTCGAINSVLIHDTKTRCKECHMIYNPQQGPADRTKATCPKCGKTFSIVSAVKNLNCSPQYRVYAKMVLKPNGEKQYLPIDQFDKSLYEKASNALKEIDIDYPIVAIQPGYNTNQVLNYNYWYWHQMFNDRQLLCLSLLAERIREIEEESLRYLFACLFSGCLEFNNMFCSFKGEGTGAVRHMFSHHILKPERTPLEANLWGTPKSSGSFSTLFESRILRALAYQKTPFELKICDNKKRPSGIKIIGINQKIGDKIATNYKEFNEKKAGIYLSCGSSSKTSIADGAVDAVITDPPFFDNVYYSQLADFFYVWQRQILGSKDVFQAKSTRSEEEVQQADADAFVNNLAAVFRDCHRVLKHEGLLIFTYHHSRHEGWSAIVEAVQRSGFYIEATHPVKSEMSVAVPKHQAKEPIDLDIIIVCRKLSFIKPFIKVPKNLLTDSDKETQELVKRFNKAGRRLSRNDIKVILMARLITTLSRVKGRETILDYLNSNEANISSLVEVIWNDQTVERPKPKELQPSLFR